MLVGSGLVVSSAVTPRGAPGLSPEVGSSCAATANGWDTAVPKPMTNVGSVPPQERAARVTSLTWIHIEDTMIPAVAGLSSL